MPLCAFFDVAQVPYVDVCDDARLATVAKGLNEKAQKAGVAATISAGIWPGIDQLMAVEVRSQQFLSEHMSTQVCFALLSTAYWGAGREGVWYCMVGSPVENFVCAFFRHPPHF